MLRSRMTFKNDIEFEGSEAAIRGIIAEASEASNTELSSTEALAVTKHRRGFSIDEEVLGVGAMMAPLWQPDRCNNGK